MKEAIWLRFQGTKAEAIQRAIETKGEFTATVARSEVKPRKHQVCLVSLQYSGMYQIGDVPDFSVDYVGISRSGSLVATDEKRIKVSNLIEAGRIDVQSLVDKMPKRHGNQVPTGFGDPIRLPPKFSEAILGAIEAQSQPVRNGMPSLRSQLAELRRVERNLDGGLEAFERDAVITSLETFGGTNFRKEILRGTQAAAGSSANFLSRLSHYNVREDSQINLDAITFPGYELTRKHIVGAVEVVNSTGQQLTILNCNRQPLEHTLGVDLIYFSHSFRSFVMVQYKRLVSQSDSKPAYFPNSDPNYAVEIQKMNEAAASLRQLPTAESGINDYRLGGDAFYFKFCEARQASALDAGMVSGFYIPLGLWNSFAASSESKGPKGGFRVDWDHRPRTMNNSKFCSLLKEGWIGSSAEQTERLEEVIQQTLEGKRMLVLAATSAAATRPDQLRDAFGRFADVDDPLGER